MILFAHLFPVILESVNGIEAQTHKEFHIVTSEGQVALTMDLTKYPTLHTIHHGRFVQRLREIARVEKKYVYIIFIGFS